MTATRDHAGLVREIESQGVVIHCPSRDGSLVEEFWLGVLDDPGDPLSFGQGAQLVVRRFETGGSRTEMLRVSVHELQELLQAVLELGSGALRTRERIS